jgi:hypothetical protein
MSLVSGFFGTALPELFYGNLLRARDIGNQLALELFHCAFERNRVKPHLSGFRKRFSSIVRMAMFQYINGTIECGECRHDIRHGDEFNCFTCGASLCESCISQHEDECAVAVGEG